MRDEHWYLISNEIRWTNCPATLLVIIRNLIKVWKINAFVRYSVKWQTPQKRAFGRHTLGITMPRENRISCTRKNRTENWKLEQSYARKLLKCTSVAMVVYGFCFAMWSDSNSTHICRRIFCEQYEWYVQHWWHWSTFNYTIVVTFRWRHFHLHVNRTRSAQLQVDQI